MTEFTCKQNHDVPPSAHGVCPTCGGRIAYMDGVGEKAPTKVRFDSSRSYWDGDTQPEEEEQE